MRPFTRLHAQSRRAAVDSDDPRELRTEFPPCRDAQSEGRATAYVCRNYACQLPVSNGGRASELLK